MQHYKKPLLLLGQGAKNSQYQEFAEKYQIPIITSRLGIDLIEYDHPLFIGHPGNYGDVPAKLAVANADIIFIVGCRLSSSIVGYTPKEWGKNAYKIMIDVDPLELNKPGIKINEKVNGDAKLLDDFELYADSQDWVKQCQDWKKQYQVVTPEMRKEKPVNSYYFTEVLSKLATKDDIVLVDTGSCFHVVAQAWKLKKGQRFITTGGLSSMGWWAASLGAAVLGNTLCITGDGSLQMNIQELATIKHYNLPIKLFVWNNEGYGLIRATQKRFNLGHIGESPETGLWMPRLYAISKAYRLPYYRITDSRYLEPIIKTVLKQEGPVLCEVMVPKWQELLRP